VPKPRNSCRSRRGADQVIDIVDLGAAHEFEAQRIDQHNGVAFGQNDIVVAGFFLYQIVFILESGTAAAGHRDAQHRAFRLLGQNARNPLGGPIGENDVVGKGCCVCHLNSMPLSNVITVRLK